MTLFIRAIAVVLLSGGALVTADEVNSGEAMDVAAVIEMRRQGFKDMGAAFKGVRDQFRRPKPVMVMIREYTKPLVRYSKEPVLENWFPEGSGPGQGVDTEALPVIWERQEDFAAHWEDYVIAAGKLQAAVASKDLDATREQTRLLGDTCKSCHDIFREEEKR